MTHEEETARLEQCTASLWDALEELEAAAQATMDAVAEIRENMPKPKTPPQNFPLKLCRTDRI